MANKKSKITGVFFGKTLIALKKEKQPFGFNDLEINFSNKSNSNFNFSINLCNVTKKNISDLCNALEKLEFP